MSLRSSGIWCDVCNEPMLTELVMGTPVKSFKLTCSPDTLHLHDKCEEPLARAVDAEDETLLPAGSPVGNLLVKVKAHNAKYAAEQLRERTKPNGNE